MRDTQRRGYLKTENLEKLKRNQNLKAKQKSTQESQPPPPPIKKIRIVFDDPDMTDSSSDEQQIPKFKKRAILEITFPETNQKTKPKPKQKGVRQRESGKWSAEIRNPILKQRLWLGTYDTPEEATNVYNAVKSKIEEEKKATKLQQGVCTSSTTTNVYNATKLKIEEEKKAMKLQKGACTSSTTTNVYDATKSKIEEEKKAMKLQNGACTSSTTISSIVASSSREPTFEELFDIHDVRCDCDFHFDYHSNMNYERDDGFRLEEMINVDETVPLKAIDDFKFGDLNFDEFGF